MNTRLEYASRIIYESRNELTQALGCEPLCGAVGGSIALNLASVASDVDLLLITDREVPLHSAVVIDDLGEVDLLCVSIAKLERECLDYQRTEHRYPTRFYRSPQEQKLITEAKDTDRLGFKRELGMKIFLSDIIIEFCPNAVNECYKRAKEGLRLIDIWDSYYNRAYGSYYEIIKREDKVLQRKYLLTISYISLCRSLMTKKNKPNLDFRTIFDDQSNNDEFIAICDSLYRENASQRVSKMKAYIPRNHVLDRWIEVQLKELLEELYNKEEYMKAHYLPLSCAVL